MSLTPRTRLGNQAAVQQLLKADWQVLSNFAQARVQNAAKTASAGGSSGQSVPQSGPAPGQAGSARPGAQNGVGTSSTNPIDMVTPQLGGSTPMMPNVQHPPFTPNMQMQNLPGGSGDDSQQQQQQQQINALRQQQRHPSFGQQGQPGLTQAQLTQLAQMQLAQQQAGTGGSGGTTGQNNNQQQNAQGSFPTPQQQARQLAQQPQAPQGVAQQQGTGGPPQKKPWSNMDFRDEAISMSEEAFWETVKKLLKNPGLAPPVIDGKVISVFTLFSLVHKNGGSAKVGLLQRRHVGHWLTIGRSTRAL